MGRYRSGVAGPNCAEPGRRVDALKACAVPARWREDQAPVMRVAAPGQAPGRRPGVSGPAPDPVSAQRTDALRRFPESALHFLPGEH